MAAAETVIEQREAEYWDGVARGLDDAELSRLNVGAEKNDKIRLDLLGDLNGKRVLDVGCGSGAWSVYLAQRGAHVWGIDISPEMVAATQRRAALLGVADRVTARTMSAMRLEFEDGFFDAVHGQDIIHHLAPDEFGTEVARVLRPGGIAVFRENCANNPVLMLARNTLCGRFGIPKWSSDDEYPLTARNRWLFARHFSKLRVEYPEFLVFHYFDAKLFRYRNRFVTAACRAFDRIGYAIPPLRRFSYKQLIQCTR